MSAIFDGLLDGTLNEVRRREASYFERFPIAFPPRDAAVESYLCRSVSAPYPAAWIANALIRGDEYLTSKCLPVTRKAGEPDPVARFMFDSMIDAFAAEQGGLSLRPVPDPGARIPEHLAQQYDRRRTAGGVGYLIRRHGSRPLLLLNAIGIPLALWTKFLTDPLHDFRVILVESRSADLLCGGVQGSTDLSTDTADIAAVLEGESIDEVDVLGWSNGGRLAVSLASKYPDQVRSLLLLAPTLSGIKGMPPVGKAFENSLQDVFLALRDNSKLASVFVKLLGERARSPDWNGMADNPEKRAETMFAMPAEEYASMLLVPMAREDDLLNYGRRITADISYPMDQALASLGMPVLLITGQYDNVISNAFASAALATYVPSFTHINVKGAGHYIHDLQYPYFLWLLESFTAALKPPAPTARIDVQTAACRKPDAVI
ncbi:alpha/beta fold hydrolase [uncultured Bradyrhizobium sp.]|uniref:alpha/beta fold hydrolase n=1 Tax=uncultured Bradyrhizobium sp. TaxID=199684 RepID=UPI0035CB2CC4